MAIAIGIGIVFLVVGVVLLLVGNGQKKKAQDAKTWPTASGVILASGLKENQSTDSDDGVTSITYEPWVNYQYEVIGKVFKCNALSFGRASYDHGTAAKKIAPYPQGAAVAVHYDPENPANAVLELKAASGLLLVIMGIVLMAIGVIAVAAGIFIQ